MDSRADHLRLDAAALLVACALSPRGLREVRPADAAHHAWRAFYRPAYLPLYDRAVRRDAAAVCDAHERHRLSGLRGRARRDLSRLCVEALAPLQRCACAQRLPFFDRLSVAAVRGTAGRSLRAARHRTLNDCGMPCLAL